MSRRALTWIGLAVLAAAVIPLGGYLVERSLTPGRAGSPVAR